MLVAEAIAARLRSSSSSACFLASAWRSLHVSFFGGPPTPPDPPPVAAPEDALEDAVDAWKDFWADLKAEDELGSDVGDCACACRPSNGFLSFLGAGSDTGV